MYIRDGIAYAGEPPVLLKVCGVRPLPDFRLWVRFQTGEAKIVDFKPLLQDKGFQALQDAEVFREVYIDYGCPVWKDGEIDIAPEYLYEKGEPAAENESA